MTEISQETMDLARDLYSMWSGWHPTMHVNRMAGWHELDADTVTQWVKVAEVIYRPEEPTAPQMDVDVLIDRLRGIGYTGPRHGLSLAIGNLMLAGAQALKRQQAILDAATAEMANDFVSFLHAATPILEEAARAADQRWEDERNERAYPAALLNEVNAVKDVRDRAAKLLAQFDI